MNKTAVNYTIFTAAVAGGCWASFREWSDLLPRLVDRAEWLTHSNANLFFLPCVIFWIMTTVGFVLKSARFGVSAKKRERVLLMFGIPGLITVVIAFFGSAIFRTGLTSAGYRECTELAHGDILIEHRYYALSQDVCANIKKELR